MVEDEGLLEATLEVLESEGDKEQGVATERFVVSNTRAAFSTYRAALEAIQSNEVAVAANTLALEGTRAEQSG